MRALAICFNINKLRNLIDSVLRAIVNYRGTATVAGSQAQFSSSRYAAVASAILLLTYNAIQDLRRVSDRNDTRRVYQEMVDREKCTRAGEKERVAFVTVYIERNGRMYI